MKGLCPFHVEKTPSFHVNRARQTYYCFGCHKGGDAISFLREIEGLSFLDALRKLADRGGVRLPALSPGGDKQEYLRIKLLEFGKFASAHYQGLLRQELRGSQGRQYLKDRQLKESTIQRFGIGYAPEAWSLLLDAAREKGFTQQVLEASGLFKAGEKGLYDFFRNRLMFPIRDAAGQVVAFGGRDLGGESPAKYINSPETMVYKKSKVLYGLHDARDAMRKAQEVFLVEGYFDALRLFDDGLDNVVATCGTALTPEQAALIRRYVPKVIVVYDGDSAGIRAAMKACGLLAAAGLTVRAMALPGGMDPDDFVKAEGLAAFTKLADQARDFIRFYVEMSADRTASIEGRRDIAFELFEILNTLDDDILRDEYVKHVARAMGLNEWSVRKTYHEFQEKHKERNHSQRENDTPEPETPLNRDDCDFIAALLAHDDLRAQARSLLATVALPAGALGTVLEAILKEQPAAAAHAEVPDARRLYAAAANLEVKDREQAAALVEKRIRRMELEALRAQAGALHREIVEAERAGDTIRQFELIKRKVDVEKQMERLGAA